MNSNLANLHAVFHVAYITVSMVYCEKAWQALYGALVIIIKTLINNNS